MVAARKAGLDEARPGAGVAATRCDPVRVRAPVHGHPARCRALTGPRVVYLKGSVEQILERCAGANPEAVHEVAAEVGANGLRVLAFARMELPAGTSRLTHADVADGLTFLGLQGMMDPPRPEAVRAVAACQSAGVRVKMITGDHAATAAAIAAQLGLGHPDGPDGLPPVLTGKQLGACPDDRLVAASERRRRLRPSHARAEAPPRPGRFRPTAEWWR